jgi:predicted PurR-regulated permease PerM
MLLVTMLLLFVYMTHIFFVPVVVAAVVTTLTYPLQTLLVIRLGGRRGLAALLSCAIIMLGVLIPIYIAITMVIGEMVELFASNQGRLLAALRTAAHNIDRVSSEGLAGLIPVPSWAPPISLESVNWQDLISSAGNALGALISGTSQGALQVLASLFVVLFTMFYFFRDGEAIVQRLRSLSPMEERYEDMLIQRMVSTSRATVRATVIIGFIQGTLGALTLSFCGIQAPVLWGVAMWVLALFPLVGTWAVMYPIGIIELVQGNIREGLVIILMTSFVISTIDNVIRPRLVGRRAGMHDLLVFFSAIGGLAAFGILGAIVGPIMASLFVALLDVYALEFKSQLEHHDLGSAQPETAEELALQLPE